MTHILMNPCFYLVLSAANPKLFPMIKHLIEMHSVPMVAAKMPQWDNHSLLRGLGGVAMIVRTIYLRQEPVVM